MQINRLWATIIGVLNGMIIFALADTPDFVPQWVQWLTSVLAAGLSCLGGLTHQGVDFKRKNNGMDKA